VITQAKLKAVGVNRVQEVDVRHGFTGLMMLKKLDPKYGASI
jgi:hypothetical protein